MFYFVIYFVKFTNSELALILPVGIGLLGKFTKH